VKFFCHVAMHSIWGWMGAISTRGWNSVKHRV
jgi:hypothetical protein